MTSNPPTGALRHARGLAGCLALLLVLGGCKGGSSDSGNSVTPCTAMVFRQSLQTPGPGDVYLRALNATCTTLDVGVFVSNLSGIFTVGFEITYPASIIQYQSYGGGPLLNQDNPPTPAQFFVSTGSPGSGSLLVSATRFRPDTTVTASGSELLITFHFLKVASGTGNLDFDTSSSSLVSAQIIDDSGNVMPAVFGPGHGGSLLVP